MGSELFHLPDACLLWALSCLEAMRQKHSSSSAPHPQSPHWQVCEETVSQFRQVKVFSEDGKASTERQWASCWDQLLLCERSQVTVELRSEACQVGSSSKLGH